MKYSMMALTLASLVMTHVGTYANTASPIKAPTLGQLHGYKAFYHAEYLKKTAAEAGGTNIILHNTELPSEGTSDIDSPSLDHLLSKAVIDLTYGPVILELPKVNDRYFSIHIIDQEHYTTYEEIRPSGYYAFVHEDYEGLLPQGATILNSRGNYPHLIIRTQVKHPLDLPNAISIQEKMQLTGRSRPLQFDNAIKFTIDTHNVYPQNERILEGVLPDYDVRIHLAMSDWITGYAKENVTDNIGMFGPIDSKEEGAQNPKKRAAALVGHLGLPANHVYSAATFKQCNGDRLDGAKAYVVTLPHQNNVDEFWSITRYMGGTRNTLANTQDVYNSYNTKPDAEGLVHITFSPKDPEDDTYWIPVVAGAPYYYIERFYVPGVGKVYTTHDHCKKIQPSTL